MSWSAHGNRIRKDKIAKIKPTQAQTDPQGSGGAYEDQLKAAIAAAELIAKQVGAAGALVNVSLGGHANPGHKSNFEDWSDETVHVSVSVVR